MLIEQPSKVYPFFFSDVSF